VALAVLTAVPFGIVAGAFPADAAVNFEARSLDGSGNNAAHPTWGQLGQPYLRVAPARYADGLSQMVSGPNARSVSNRVFSDNRVNIFSERSVSQWGWAWGQFLDHTFGLAQGGTENADIPFSASDPLEQYRDDFGVVPFTRDAAAPGTGTSKAREQVNTVNS